jgi:hypothetical protein
LSIQRSIFWTVIVLGGAGIAWLLATDPRNEATVKPVSRTASNEIGRLINAEIEVEPVFLLEQRARLPDISQFWAMVEYPVFVPARNSMVMSAQVHSPVEVERTLEILKDPPPVRLVGTVVRSDRTMALITDEGHSFLRPVYLGEEIDGWSVEAIDGESLLLTRGDQSHVFSILSE